MQESFQEYEFCFKEYASLIGSSKLLSLQLKQFIFPSSSVSFLLYYFGRTIGVKLHFFILKDCKYYPNFAGNCSSEIMSPVTQKSQNCETKCVETQSPCCCYPPHCVSTHAFGARDISWLCQDTRRSRAARAVCKCHSLCNGGKLRWQRGQFGASYCSTSQPCSEPRICVWWHIKQWAHRSLQWYPHRIRCPRPSDIHVPLDPAHVLIT